MKENLRLTIYGAAFGAAITYTLATIVNDELPGHVFWLWWAIGLNLLIFAYTFSIGGDKLKESLELEFLPRWYVILLGFVAPVSGIVVPLVGVIRLVDPEKIFASLRRLSEYLKGTPKRGGK